MSMTELFKENARQFKPEFLGDYFMGGIMAAAATESDEELALTVREMILLFHELRACIYK